MIRTFVLEGGYALCCKFLPGGTLIVVGFKNGDLELYDLATSSLVDRVEKAHSAITVGGAAPSNDDSAAIWSLDITQTGKLWLQVVMTNVLNFGISKLSKILYQEPTPRFLI